MHRPSLLVKPRSVVLLHTHLLPPVQQRTACTGSPAWLRNPAEPLLQTSTPSSVQLLCLPCPASRTQPVQHLMHSLSSMLRTACYCSARLKPPTLALGSNAGGGGGRSPGEVAALQRLDLRLERLASLQGLECWCPNLQVCLRPLAVARLRVGNAVAAQARGVTVQAPLVGVEPAAACGVCFLACKRGGRRGVGAVCAGTSAAVQRTLGGGGAGGSEHRGQSLYAASGR